MLEPTFPLLPAMGCWLAPPGYYITPHTDCIEGDAFVTIHKIKKLGCKAGIALSPSVPLSTIEYYLPLLDKVTIMIVDPGISGQPVDLQMFVKINQLAKLRRERGLKFIIEADGSMNSGLYRPLYEAGADLVVLGPPALWNKDADFKKAWSIMEADLERELDGAADFHLSCRLCV